MADGATPAAVRDRLGRGYRSRPGRRPRSGAGASRFVSIRVTPEERAELVLVARENRMTLTGFIREAVNEAVSDYREAVVFRRDWGSDSPDGG